MQMAHFYAVEIGSFLAQPGRRRLPCLQGTGHSRPAAGVPRLAASAFPAAVAFSPASVPGLSGAAGGDSRGGGIGERPGADAGGDGWPVSATSWAGLAG